MDIPPFEPVIKNDVIYARGSADDKGQFYMHVKAVEAMLKENALPCNVACHNTMATLYHTNEKSMSAAAGMMPATTADGVCSRCKVCGRPADCL